MRFAAPAVVTLAVAALALASSAGGNHSLRELVSIGSTGGNGPNTAFFDGTTADGTRAFFETDERLVAADTDNTFDIYERAAGATTLVSIGPTGGNGASDAFYDANSADGSKLLFETDEQLVAEDTDSQFDIYQRSGGTTTLVSTGATGGNGTFDAFWVGTSSDGARTFFETDEQLEAGDTDASQDVYVRSAGSTSLLSTGSAGGNGAFVASFRGASEDGSRAFIETTEQLESGDTDAVQDVYERSGAATTLISTGAAGGNGAVAAFYDGTSSDGTRVFFHTAESLESGDGDAQTDVYERTGTTTTLVSTGSAGGNGAAAANFDGASADGTRVFFHTAESLESGDGDAQTDIYERSGSTTTLVSTGPNGGNGPMPAFFDGTTSDGTKVFFDTTESLLTPDDADTSQDVYQRSGGSTTLISTGPNGGNGPTAAFFDGAATDGSRVFFDTAEALVTPADSDAQVDVYERQGGTTTLVSTGSAGGNGPIGAFFDASSRDGKRVYFDTREKLLASDTDSVRDVYLATVAEGYPRPPAGVNFRVPLTVAYEECLPAAENRTHGPALTAPSCNPALRESDYLTVGTRDANGPDPKFAGFVRLTALPGTAVDPGDDADVRLEASAQDVRNTDLSDYTGELAPTLTLRITDRHNGSAPVDSATTTEIPFSFVAPCTATADTTVGSTCSIVTSADTVLSGAVVEGKRSNWEIGQVRVLDGGADGLAGTSPNTVFARQGVFVP